MDNQDEARGWMWGKWQQRRRWEISALVDREAEIKGGAAEVLEQKEKCEESVKSIKQKMKMRVTGWGDTEKSSVNQFVSNVQLRSSSFSDWWASNCFIYSNSSKPPNISILLLKFYYNKNLKDQIINDSNCKSDASWQSLSSRALKQRYKWQTGDNYWQKCTSHDYYYQYWLSINWCFIT